MQLRGKQRICPLRTDADWLLPFGFPVVVGAAISQTSLSEQHREKETLRLSRAACSRAPRNEWNTYVGLET